MENTPSLAGQPELFLTNQLILMRDRIRLSEVMAPFVKGLNDDVIIASLPRTTPSCRPRSPADRPSIGPWCQARRPSSP